MSKDPKKVKEQAGRMLRRRGLQTGGAASAMLKLRRVWQASGEHEETVGWRELRKEKKNM